MDEFDKLVFIDYAIRELENQAISPKTLKPTATAENAILAVSKLLVQLKESGKDLTTISQLDMRKFFEKHLIGFSEGRVTGNKESNALSKFLQYADSNDWITGTHAYDKVIYAKSVSNQYNEWTASGAGKSPTKPGARKAAIMLAMNSGDVGSQISAKLSSRYYIRYDEIMHLGKALKNHGKEGFDRYCDS